MGVYIKGMKMPTTCEECCLESFCGLWIEAIKMSDVELKVGAKATIRHPDCPLVPVPDHGRLIDADGSFFPTPHKKALNDYMKGWNTCLRSVMQQPTIIPADPDGEGEKHNG